MKNEAYVPVYHHYFIKIIFLAGIILLPVLSIKAQLTEKYKTYKQAQYHGMRYGFFTPASTIPGEKYPLVLYLHGANDTVSRDLSLYQPASQRSHPCFVLTPKCLEANQGWGNTWQDKHSTATANTLQLLDSLVKIYPIDINRLYIYGISMGGFGVFSVLQKNPGKFAAGYSVCGGSDPRASSALLTTPLWIFHGSEDDVVPVRLSRDIYEAIKKDGGTLVHYTEYPGVKHNSWENVSREDGLTDWLFKQRKGNNRL